MNGFPDGVVQIPLEVKEAEQFAGRRNHKRVNDLALLMPKCFVSSRI
jgi:hypothetical protein